MAVATEGYSRPKIFRCISSDWRSKVSVDGKSPPLHWLSPWRRVEAPIVGWEKVYIECKATINEDQVYEVTPACQLVIGCRSERKNSIGHKQPRGFDGAANRNLPFKSHVLKLLIVPSCDIRKQSLVMRRSTPGEPWRAKTNQPGSGLYRAQKRRRSTILLAPPSASTSVRLLTASGLTPLISI